MVLNTYFSDGESIAKAEKKEPYGHTAYQRTTPTGKIAQVPAKGVKLPKETKDPKGVAEEIVEGAKAESLDAKRKLQARNDEIRSQYGLDKKTTKEVEVGNNFDIPTKKEIKERLEYLRGEILAERISTGEIAELQSLAKYIDSGDTLLLEWAGVEEFPDDL